ncbi:MAG: ribosome silencing factor [Candidatus Omnitrophota bacterium]|nr:ribosome silencing factor [Candidatus Omnitrophota bacterium]
MSRLIVVPPRRSRSTATEGHAKALLAARTALEKQGEDVIVLDLRSLSSVTEFFVICTAGSARQLTALKEHLEAAFAQQAYEVWHTEGTTAAPSAFNHAPQWILMDCGDVVIHLLDHAARAFYRLEDLWADAPRIPLTL